MQQLQHNLSRATVVVLAVLLFFIHLSSYGQTTAIKAAPRKTPLKTLQKALKSSSKAKKNKGAPHKIVKKNSKIQNLKNSQIETAPSTSSQSISTTALKSSDQASAKVQLLDEKAKPSFSASISTEQNLYKVSDHLDKRANSYVLTASIPIGNWNLGSKVGYSHDLKDSEGSDWQDVSFSLGHKPTSISNNFNFGYGFSTVAPVSKDSRIRQNLYGVLGGGISISSKPDILWKGFGLSTGLSLSRLVHQYETATDGKINSQWSSRQTLGGSYSYKQISLSATFIHRNTMNYQSYLKESFLHSEEIRWAPNAKMNFSLGHSLEGSALKPNGVDSNLAFLDTEDSTIYLSFGYTF